MGKARTAKWEKTKQGRIVYNRKKNPFRKTDLLRISRRLPVVQWTVTSRGMDVSVAFFEALFSDTSDVIYISGSFGPGEAGYEPGGDRAGRPARIMLIIEGY
ncbi:hypothetical protein ES705_41884 [subsurface metagenome]